MSGGGAGGMVSWEELRAEVERQLDEAVPPPQDPEEGWGVGDGGGGGRARSCGDGWRRRCLHHKISLWRYLSRCRFSHYSNNKVVTFFVSFLYNGSAFTGKGHLYIETPADFNLHLLG